MHIWQIFLGGNGSEGLSSTLLKKEEKERFKIYHAS